MTIWLFRLSARSCPFNSHPHKEDDFASSCYIYGESLLSTHILTRRMTRFIPLCSFLFCSFNSHPHKEDDSGTLLSLYTLISFQLTSSQGGWQVITLFYKPHWVFQLTSSQGGWLLYLPQRFHIKSFNSHPHKEDDSHIKSIIGYRESFNSHPHKEDDIWGCRKVRKEYPFNSHPHKEDDVLLSDSRNGNVPFNSHPHKEDDK